MELPVDQCKLCKLFMGFVCVALRLNASGYCFLVHDGPGVVLQVMLAHNVDV
jgi:hypothetical protein